MSAIDRISAGTTTKLERMESAAPPPRVEHLRLVGVRIERSKELPHAPGGGQEPHHHPRHTPGEARQTEKQNCRASPLGRRDRRFDRSLSSERVEGQRYLLDLRTAEALSDFAQIHPLAPQIQAESPLDCRNVCLFDDQAEDRAVAVPRQLQLGVHPLRLKRGW